MTFRPPEPTEPEVRPVGPAPRVALRPFVAILERARSQVGLQLTLSLLVCFVAPAILLAAVTELVQPVLGWVLYGVAVAYLLTCLLMLAEANLAVRRSARALPPPASDGWDPTVTLIVVAYLPNEVDIIEETLLHLCREVDVPEGRLQVLLAYNTDRRMPLEQDLRDLAERVPEIDVLCVPGSVSKAENIMGALPHVRGEVTAILDADHHLRRDAAQIALRWIDQGYDVVQGRCIIRNTDRNVLTKVIGAEFEGIYGIAHSGRSLLTDTAIFGGANGWWRTDVLRRLGVDHRMLTEDIDVSMRALLSGYRIVHERAVVSTELAPATFRGWWKQRTRWAQGWFQVTIRHTPDVRRSRVLGPWVRFYWLVMLVWREMFPIISLQIFTVLAAQAIAGLPFHLLRDPFLIATTIITLLTGVVLGLASYRTATDESRRALGLQWFVVYCVLALPYTVLKNAVAQAAMVREIVGDRRWMVTRREGPRTPPRTVLGGPGSPAPGPGQPSPAPTRTIESA
ncbi:glycosyltransferase [Patulibacter minatonensis]|uniref:glycosyltransferase n=1 Tax=Patulibacter minatonensis TaxID=298163 RepID=UPI0006886B0D|nr:glycosyltransferase family 2 protein [Patulibacter minatonensis]